jgi:tetratricopeptide (TPR) repeat protein
MAERVAQEAMDSTVFLRTLARAETATATECWEHAAALWTRVTSANPTQASYWTKLGQARKKAEDYRGAIPAFERALELRDGFPFDTAYRLVACHALLGENADALSWLVKALEFGYRDLPQARKDDDLASLRDDPTFRELLGIVDTDGLSRDEGWRADLRFFSREVKRRAYAPFAHISEANFDAEIAEIAASVPERTDHQILVALQRFLGHLYDGHAWVWRNDMHERALPVLIELFEEGPFVTAARTDVGELLGAEVLRFDDVPAGEVVAAVEATLCRDNDSGPRSVVPRLIREPALLHALGLVSDPNRVTLTTRLSDGRETTVALEAAAGIESRKIRDNPPCPEGWLYLPETIKGEPPLYLKNRGVTYWFEVLDQEHVVYAQINAIADRPGESLGDFAVRLVDTAEAMPGARLVLDLRWNGGGNTFLELPLLRRLIGSRTLNRRGRLFAIIGPATFSAAQNFINILDSFTDVIFVGEPSGSSPSFVGESWEFELPYSKASANVSDLFWQTGWALDYRTWIAPTLYTPPTFATFRENRDPAMEAILAYREELPGIVPSKGD